MYKLFDFLETPSFPLWDELPLTGSDLYFWVFSMSISSAYHLNCANFLYSVLTIYYSVHFES